MEVSISRRSLAIGGPAALAASSLAPLGVLGTLAGVHTPAAAAPVLTPDGFDAYYKNTFHNRAVDLSTFRLAVIIARDEAVTRNIQYNITRTAQIQAQLSSPAQITNYLTANNYNLTIAGPAFPGVTRWDWICNNLRADISTDATLKVDFGAYLNWITTTLTDDELNVLIQHRMRLWHHMERFLYMCLTKAAYTTFMQRIASIEAKDDRRYLQETIKDELVEETDWLGRKTGNLRMRWGNRPLIERIGLVNLLSWFENLFGYAKYAPLNESQHGIDTTAVDTSYNRNLADNTTAYYKGDDQKYGLEYYVNRDINEIGPYPNMTRDESRKHLTALCEDAYRLTGHVYASYAMATYFSRAISQGVIALTRFQLYNTGINLPAMVQSAMDLAESQPAVKQAADWGRFQMTGVLTLLGACVASNIVLMGTTIYATRNAVREGKLANWTEAQMATRTKNLILGWTGGGVTLAQLNAMGLLGYVSFGQSAAAEAKVKWVGVGFAGSDFISAVGTAVGIFSSRTGLTDLTAPVLTGAIVQASAHSATIWQFYWKGVAESRGETYTPAVPALKITTLSATTVSALSFVAGVMALHQNGW
jgi:hypothetical protein